MKCSSCGILEPHTEWFPLCSVCFFSVPATTDIDHSIGPDASRFQKYLVEGIRLSEASLTRRLIREGFCPHTNRTAQSRARSLRLLEEARQNEMLFKESCRD